MKLFGSLDYETIVFLHLSGSYFSCSIQFQDDGKITGIFMMSHGDNTSFGDFMLSACKFLNNGDVSMLVIQDQHFGDTVPQVEIHSENFKTLNEGQFSVYLQAFAFFFPPPNAEYTLDDDSCDLQTLKTEDQKKVEAFSDQYRDLLSQQLASRIYKV